VNYAFTSIQCGANTDNRSVLVGALRADTIAIFVVKRATQATHQLFKDALNLKAQEAHVAR